MVRYVDRVADRFMVGLHHVLQLRSYIWTGDHQIKSSLSANMHLCLIYVEKLELNKTHLCE